MDNDCLMSFSPERPFGLRCWVEDDGRVAYAYMGAADGIVADVWLYNRMRAGDVPEWIERRVDPPFLNHPDFASSDQFEPIKSDDQVSFKWVAAEAASASVRVYIRGNLHAVLVRGATPGQCVLATRAGPLAKPLDLTD